MAKKTFIKSMILVIMVALASVVANAQAVITTINARDTKACGEYLQNNLTDTIVNIYNIDGGTITRRVYVQGTILRITNDTILYKSVSVQAVHRTEEGVSVVSKIREDNGNVKKDTTHYMKTNTEDITFETKESILRGEKRIMDPRNVDYDGNLRHKVQVSVLGGAALSDGNVTPTGTLRLSYESCRFLYELEGGISSLKHTKEAEFRGKYLSYTAQANLGWKFLQDTRSRSYLAVLISGGYGLCQSDGEDAAARTRTYGFVAGAMLRGSLGLTSHLRLIAEGGYKLFPELPHDQNQDLSCQGGFVSLGVGYAF